MPNIKSGDYGHSRRLDALTLATQLDFAPASMTFQTLGLTRLGASLCIVLVRITLKMFVNLRTCIAPASRIPEAFVLSRLDDGASVLYLVARRVSQLNARARL